MELDGEQSPVLFVSLPRHSLGYSCARPTAQGAKSMMKKTGKRASRHTILAIDVGGSRVKFMTDKARTNARLRPVPIFPRKRW